MFYVVCRGVFLQAVRVRCSLESKLLFPWHRPQAVAFSGSCSSVTARLLRIATNHMAMCSSARSCSDLNIFLRRSDVRVSILCVRQGIGFRGIDRPSGGANARAGASASGIAPVFSMRLETLLWLSAFHRSRMLHVLTLILPLRLWASHGVHLSSLTQN